MNENRKYGILWGKWLGGFAMTVWIIGTYGGLLLGAAVMSVMFARGTARPDVVGAVAGVMFATMLHLMLFCMIEHGELKRLNKEQ